MVLRELVVDLSGDQVPRAPGGKRSVVDRERRTGGDRDRQGPILVDELVAGKEMGLVEPNRAARRAAESLLSEVGLGFLEVAPVPQFVIPSVGERRTVETVGARLGDDIEYRLERLPILGVKAVGDDLELLD